MFSQLKSDPWFDTEIYCPVTARLGTHYPNSVGGDIVPSNIIMFIFLCFLTYKLLRLNLYEETT